MRQKRTGVSDEMSGGKGFVIFILCAAVLAASFCLFFRIGTINVSGTNEEYTAETVIEASGIKTGTSLLLLNTEKAEQMISDIYPYISYVTITKSLPSTVNISITATSACAAVTIDGEKWLVDMDLRKLEKADGSRSYLDIIGLELEEHEDKKGVVTHSLTENFDNETQYEYTKIVLKELCRTRIADNVSQLDVTNIGNITFRYGKQTVKLGSGERIEYKLARLTEILSKLEPQDIGTIDISRDGEAYFTPLA